MQDFAQDPLLGSAAPHSSRAGTIRRGLGFAYAVTAYLGFLGAFGLFALRTMGYAESWGLTYGPSFDEPAFAVLFDVGLVFLFGVQHSVMARQTFKRGLIRFVPQALERATYLWASNVALSAVALLWSRVPGTIWTVTRPALHWGLWVVGVLGWGIVVGSSFLIDHFELFGLRQAWSWLRARPMPGVAFRAPSAYRALRHPMMLGVLVGLWSAPTMDVVRLILALSMTAYVLVGVGFEERDLVRLFGKRYTDYQQTVPRLLPRPLGRRARGDSLPHP